MRESELPILDWPAIAIVILLIIGIVSVIGYVFWKSISGLTDNDESDLDEDEDNVIVDILRGENHHSKY